MTARAPRAALLPSLFAASLAVLAVVPRAPAAEVTLVAVRDNTIYSDGALSNGKGTGLFAGRNTSGAPRRALLAFDVAAAVPAGSTITAAELELEVTKSMSGSQTMTVHRLLADWGEGTSNANGEEGAGAPATTGDATWLFRFFNTQMWAVAGGDFNSQASASSQFDMGSATWESTPQLVADVQGWLDAPDSNFGWLVRGDEAHNTTTKRFGSRESGSMATRPKLVIEYDPPGGSATPTATATLAPSPTQTTSPTVAPPTATATHTTAATGTATAVPPTPSATAINTELPTPLSTATATVTSAPTATPTASQPPSPTMSATPTQSPPPTDTVTSAPAATAEPATPTPTETPTALSCTGDCDISDAVAIDELILGVNIALGAQPLSACPAFDPSGNGAVEINELVAAVNDALSGCE